MEILAKCNQCDGTGINPLSPEPGNICVSCGGTGKTVIGDIEELNTTDIKLDSIIAEQASQRADLTAALTQIWNKVKDL